MKFSTANDFMRLARHYRSVDVDIDTVCSQEMLRWGCEGAQGTNSHWKVGNIR